jgi:hypothetical protein
MARQDDDERHRRQKTRQKTRGEVNLEAKKEKAESADQRIEVQPAQKISQQEM